MGRLRIVRVGSLRKKSFGTSCRLPCSAALQLKTRGSAPSSLRSRSLDPSLSGIRCAHLCSCYAPGAFPGGFCGECLLSFISKRLLLLTTLVPPRASRGFCRKFHSTFSMLHLSPVMTLVPPFTLRPTLALLTAQKLFLQCFVNPILTSIPLQRCIAPLPWPALYGGFAGRLPPAAGLAKGTAKTAA